MLYIYELDGTNRSLLKYKFEIGSQYNFEFHGYKIKRVFECRSKINQFDGNPTNNRFIWAAHKNFNTNGKIIKKCINCNNWKLIETFKTNKDVSNQELIDADPYIKKHIENEGKIITQTIASHNRSQTLRDKYLEKYGTECKLCHKFLLKANGNDYIIDVHHLHPISNGEHETNIDTDLVGLCPNCHRFVHTIEDFENKSLDQIKQIFNKINNKN